MTKRYRRKRTGEEVELIGECLTKEYTYDGVEWVDAVVYRTSESQLFCRRRHDFRLKYEPITDDKETP